MPADLLPRPAPDEARPVEPLRVTEAFLHDLAAGDLEGSTSWLADDVEYTNMGLPTIRGRERVAQAFGALERPGLGFEAYLHSISSDGAVVLTERTDVITVGSFRAQFWVWGRFDVHDGEITLWRDSFDFLDVTRGILRGALGMALPGLRPDPPRPGDRPGR
jgi:limonene-1,2-epoxide hydrolase